MNTSLAKRTLIKVTLEAIFIALISLFYVSAAWSENLVYLGGRGEGYIVDDNRNLHIQRYTAKDSNILITYDNLRKGAFVSVDYRPSNIVKGSSPLPLFNQNLSLQFTTEQIDKNDILKNGFLTGKAIANNITMVFVDKSGKTVYRKIETSRKTAVQFGRNGNTQTFVLTGKTAVGPFGPSAHRDDGDDNKDRRGEISFSFTAKAPPVVQQNNNNQQDK